MKLNYFLNGMQITSQEYQECLIDDALTYGETKTTALRVIKENREEARTEGFNEWTLFEGDVLAIRVNK